ncbi:Protein O-mannosyl-transferase TMTC2 like protein [Argiope bruennichi]|uniref:Protein O-mannosyl-transferase TMTC2 like protein n=1 Tax=Argiope bruennichi TaxID=94029 RepID=A0A8T0FK81_ARGBR|nr:Protein O-mannosyl-transferase TMTC2 like protein [Argiope bruennichi]
MEGVLVEDDKEPKGKRINDDKRNGDSQHLVGFCKKNGLSVDASKSPQGKFFPWKLYLILHTYIVWILRKRSFNGAEHSLSWGRFNEVFGEVNEGQSYEKFLNESVHISRNSESLRKKVLLFMKFCLRPYAVLYSLLKVAVPDPNRAIKTNQDLLPSTPIEKLFLNDFWGTPLTHSGSHKSYRPLCVLTFRLNYWLGGFTPWGYHFINVFLHMLVSVAFTKLAYLVFAKKPMPTIIAGLLFTAHPIHTEAVAGIVGRADVGACLFFLLSIMLYIKYCEYRSKEERCLRRWFYLYAALFCAACSMLTKEQGITVLGVCIVYELFVRHRIFPKELRYVPLQTWIRRKISRETNVQGKEKPISDDFGWDSCELCALK